MALNILLTLTLVLRLLFMRRKIVRVLGQEFGTMYAGAATILLESGLPYGIISFIFIVLYGIQNTAGLLFIPLIMQLEVSHPVVNVFKLFVAQTFLVHHTPAHSPSCHSRTRIVKGSRLGRVSVQH